MVLETLAGQIAVAIENARAYELERQAAEQWINTGHLNRGMDALRASLSDIGEPLAPSPRRALLRVVWNRVRLRLRGIPIRWQSEITAWEPPHRFVDEQRRGPYRAWIHEHTFEERGGETIARDRVQYDHLDHEPIHLDLARVDVDERVTVLVGIELRGVPKGVSEGGRVHSILAVSPSKTSTHDVRFIVLGYSGERHDGTGMGCASSRE